MRILLLGKFGQLGWELHRALAPLGEVLALDYPEIDLASEESARQTVRAARPQVIFNATAYTAVDRAENEAELAFAINARAAGWLAHEARAAGAALVHYSTDYVFDGTKGSDYVETDLPNPLGVYGRSKLAGEQAIQSQGGAYLILRTSWVYSLRRDSFVTKVLQWSRQQPELRLVTDQVGNPTWCRLLAQVSALLLARLGANPYGSLFDQSGLYHLAGSGRANRLEWAQAILQFDPQRHEQVTTRINPALTAEFPSPARRPLHSALNSDLFTKTFGLQLPPWQTALQLAMESPA